jgi:outer membrane protein TolC
MNKLLPLSAVVLFASFPAVATAQQTLTLTERQAIEEALAKNPSLQASMIDAAAAQQDVLAEEGRFVPVFEADAGFTHNESPRLRSGASGEVSVSKGNTWAVGSQLSHTFPWGTQLTLRVDGTRSTNKTQTVPGTDQYVTLGPGYDLTGRLTLVQPLLRGAGTDVGEAALRQARLARTASERAQDVAASQLLRDVLTAYWELWYRDRSVEIEKSSRDLAVKQRDEARQRQQSGALAPIDVLSFETQVAQRDQSLASAEVQRQQQALQLQQLLGSGDFVNGVQTSDQTPAEDLRTPPSRRDVLKAAVDQSLEVKAAQAQLDVARDRLKTAGENQRPRLDLEGYVQSEGLAYKEVPPAFARFGTGQALSAHIGIVFELPLSDTTMSAQRRSAMLAVDSAEAKLSAARQQAESQAASQLAQARGAERRVKLAEAAAEAAKKQFTAQQARYARGAGTAIEVQQAQDALRQAELSVERARVDRVDAILALEHLTGELLRAHAGAVKQSAIEGARTRARKVGFVRTQRGLF